MRRSNWGTFIQATIAGFMVIPSIPVVTNKTTATPLILCALACVLCFLFSSSKALERNGWMAFACGIACGFSLMMLIIGKAAGTGYPEVDELMPFFVGLFIVSLGLGVVWAGERKEA